MDSNVFLTRLSEIPGIGESTRQWVALRALRDPDAFPAADRALARVLSLGTSTDFEQHSLAWRPWRGYAAIYLWTFGAEIKTHGNGLLPSASKKECDRLDNILQGTS